MTHRTKVARVASLAAAIPYPEHQNQQNRQQRIGESQHVFAIWRHTRAPFGIRRPSEYAYEAVIPLSRSSARRQDYGDQP